MPESLPEPDAAPEPELHGDAATVVLLRESPRGPEVLLLERPSHRGSFAGAWVFPGGHVDHEDREAVAAQTDPEVARAAGHPVPDLHDGGAPDPLLAAALRAGVRETFEETGLEVLEAELAGFSMWTPPPTAPKRLRTWFFLAIVDAGSSQHLRLSPDEHVDHAWLTPAEALQRHGEGAISLVPPTWMTLRWLARQDSAAGAVEAARSRPPADFRSLRTVDEQGRPIVAWAGDEAYDVGGLAGPAGARNRVHLGSLPWVRERTPREG
ncbi:NUDIX domain-containing protein [Arthrobacter sp. JSM 101049]|uniref:NUDIX hydrolase n=1 Tax=Arthrobacter sp. JSM 101049 TaxID=929097 RepID=UPI003562EAC0